ncbi:MAG: hypothetical protein H6609_17335 [Ignavibacteriales bacterium]|nr:hypothetical protein [Ignavibacteriales bacterium]
MDTKFIAVSGFGWSGSGALIDLLKEYKGFDTLGFEFSLIKEPHGIMDLENYLLNNWEVLRHDKAIRDFLNYCKILARKSGKYQKYGHDFNNKLNINFYEESLKYVNKLTDFTYSGHTRILEYDLNTLSTIKRKVFARITKKRLTEQMYFGKPSYDLFLAETKNYLKQIFNHFIKNKGIQNLILDQAIPTSNSHIALKYFDEVDFFIVDRDPRDIYVDMINNRSLLGTEFMNSNQDTSKYIKWHESLRDYAVNSNINIFRFEDIVFNTDNVIKRIENILNTKLIKTKKSFFNSSNSSKNIGLWKTYPNKAEIKYIEDHLSKYIFKIS